MDETDDPQSPEELLFILAALGEKKVPLQTIAPKFTGRFNKGVDYEGDVEQFNREFNDDVCVIHRAVNQFSLPENLKLSVHSGSDYDPNIRQLLHVGYKVAAELDDIYLPAQVQERKTIAKHVTDNLYYKHIMQLFLE